MWLHVPGLDSPSALESEDWSSVSDSPWAEDTELWAIVSGKPSLRPLSWPSWKRRSWIRRLFGTISKPSRATSGAERWISSLPASPASRGAMRVNGRAPRTTGGCGPTSAAPSGRSAPGGCSSRMSPASPPVMSTPPSASTVASTRPGPGVQRPQGNRDPFAMLVDGIWRDVQPTLFSTRGSPPYCGTLPSSGSMRSGRLSAREDSALTTSGRGSLFSGSPWARKWPTPRGKDHKTSDGNPGGGRERGMGGALNNTARQWPTPVATDSESTGRESLTDAIRGWPTPSARDYKGGVPPNRTEGTGIFAERRDQLDRVAEVWPTPRRADGENATEYITRSDGSKPSLLGASRSIPPGPTSLRCGPECSKSHRRLNPRFVEWLMRWPIGLTGSEPLGTEWTRWQRRWRSWLSGRGFTGSR